MLLLRLACLLAGCESVNETTEKICIEGSGYGAKGGVCWYPKHKDTNRPASLTLTNSAP